MTNMERHIKGVVNWMIKNDPTCMVAMAGYMREAQNIALYGCADPEAMRDDMAKAEIEAKFPPKITGLRNL